jgi:hypothetical protein
MPNAKEQEYQSEAERLAQLPRADQAAVVAMYRQLAGNALATPACRAEAKAKAKALEKLLGLRPARKPAKARGRAKAGKASVKTSRKR